MISVRMRGESARKFILEHVDKHPRDIARVAAQTLGISRQAALRHLNLLADEKALIVTGKTTNRTYALPPLVEWGRTYAITPSLAEDVVWRDDVAPLLGKLPRNVLEIWSHGFTEMFNNAIDHSSGTVIEVRVRKTAAGTDVSIWDDGVGIFRKIQAALGLLDERHAVLELAKGKLTTDPANHSGEGIFFSSRMFDDFEIVSGGTYFSHQYDRDEDWILERRNLATGTAVWMRLNNHTSRTARKIFEKFTAGDDIAFSKTVVPVRLAQYGDDKLVSRSQAKRLLDRVDRFKVVILDFAGVDSIGQAFADEIFRVFPRRHPELEMHHVNANANVKQMIERALATTVA